MAYHEKVFLRRVPFANKNSGMMFQMRTVGAPQFVIITEGPHDNAKVSDGVIESPQQMKQGERPRA